MLLAPFPFHLLCLGKRWSYRRLQKLRTGDCEVEDLREMHKLILGSTECDMPNFDIEPWSEGILITTRHGVRLQWNAAALRKHAACSGHRVYISQAEDVQVDTGEPITIPQKIVALGMTIKQTAKVAEKVEVAIGMKAMVIINIATEADLANGTRGTVTDIVLDPRETLDEPDEDGAMLLKYPPALLLFKPDVKAKEHFPGLPEGIIPISPFEATFSVIVANGKKNTVFVVDNWL
jgi:hypothetical protein